jgi:hypothetical protein
MNTYKEWFKKLLMISMLVISPLVIGVMYFNYYIDPLWNFDHKNEWNDYQVGFDERQQKTNYILSRPFQYESLLIGTSRVTYMDQHEFKDEKVFNYSLSSLHIDEYLPYIEFAEKQNGEPFDKVYMELYFESFNKNSKNHLGEPVTYFEKAADPVNKYTSLFSYNTFKQSLENLRASKANEYSGPRSYNRDNVAVTTYPNTRLPALLDRFINHFEANQFKDKYPYDEEYKEKLVEIKKQNPQTEFIVFTDPIPAERMDIVLSNPVYWEAYERWYTEMVEVYDKVYSFQSINSISTDRQYWLDWFHYYPNIGSEMIATIENRGNKDSFGIIVTKENLNDYLNLIKQQIEDYEFEK